MKNNENGNAVMAGILIALIFSLLFSSAAISYFSIAKLGNSEVSAINFPTGAITYSGNQDFSDCSYNSSTWFKALAGKWNNYCGIGIVLEMIDPTRVWTWLILGNEIPSSDGTVKNTYTINNTPLGDYTIILRYTGSIDQNEIQIKSDGFHVPNYVIPTFGLSGQAVPIGDLDFSAYSGASQIKDAIITTYYNNKLGTCTLVFNGQTIFSIDNLKPDGNLFGIWAHYYGGVGAINEGFTITNFNTENQIALSDDTSLLNMVLNFITTMLQIIVWTLPESIFPIILNIIFIKSQLAGIVVCLVILARG